MQLENIVDEIEVELQQRAVREVSSIEIGELVLKYLRTLNEVAYIRFASVYKQFRGIRDFVETLDHLKESTEQAETVPVGSENRVATAPLSVSR
jgi:transcriptional repressor NrdR